MRLIVSCGRVTRVVTERRRRERRGCTRNDLALRSRHHFDLDSAFGAWLHRPEIPEQVLPLNVGSRPTTDETDPRRKLVFHVDVEYRHTPRVPSDNFVGH